MKDNKDHDRSKLDGAEIDLQSSSPVIKWLDNFWYHHKWKVIVIGLFAIILAVCIWQMAEKEEIDETIVIAVPRQLYLEEIEGIDAVLSSLMPKNGENEKNLLLQTYPIYTEDEMQAVNEEETNDEGHYVVKVFPAENMDRVEAYNSYLNTGEVSLILVSPYLYENQRIHDRLMPLSEIFGEKLPQGAMSDGFGVRLGDTALYAHSEAMRVLPADTIVCLRRPYIFGAGSDKDRYAETKALFMAIVMFGN